MDHNDPSTSDSNHQCYRPAVDVAKQLGVTTAALAKMRHQGDGPPYVKVGSRVRYGDRDLYHWLHSRRQDHT
jgi:hypothetical protein